MADSGATTSIERNKFLVSELYDKVYNGKDMSVLSRLFASDYVEHNPELENGRIALEGFLNKVFGLFPEMSFTLARLVAEGDLVVAHALMRRTPDDRGTVIAELFRISGGRIVERWDVTTPVPEETRNRNTVI